jgi:predicted TIM-barrel fold metal-dependent hydrolase
VAPWAAVAKQPARDGRALLAELDAAGIEKAVVLSVGYSFADERKKPPRPRRPHPRGERLDVGAGGGRRRAPHRLLQRQPAAPGRARELERCLGLPGMRGVKLHFGNGGVTLRDPAHLRRTQEVFGLAQRLGRPVLVHMRARGGANYGGEDARLFLAHVVPTAPDVEVVVAHLGYTGPGYPEADSVMAAFGEAAERHDPRMRNVYFDVATNVTEETPPAAAALVARRIRQVGPRRVLYGSDLTAPGGSVRSGWRIFRDRVPLSADELRTIAGNVARFAR